MSSYHYPQQGYSTAYARPPPTTQYHDAYGQYDRRQAPPPAQHYGYGAPGQMSMQARPPSYGYGAMPPAQSYPQGYQRAGVAPPSPVNYNAPAPGYGAAVPAYQPPLVPTEPDRSNMLNLEGAKKMVARNERIILKLILLQVSTPLNQSSR